jgi:hypothetical protein
MREPGWAKVTKDPSQGDVFTSILPLWLLQKQPNQKQVMFRSTKKERPKIHNLAVQPQLAADFCGGQ